MHYETYTFHAYKYHCLYYSMCELCMPVVTWGESNPHIHISGAMLYQLSYQAPGSKVVGRKSMQVLVLGANYTKLRNIPGWRRMLNNHWKLFVVLVFDLEDP